jgi:hypothetical protein
VLFEELHLVAISVLVVAAKYEEIVVPKIIDFMMLGKGNPSISKQTILRMESRILCELGFDFGYVSPMHFIEILGRKLNLS